MAGRQSMISHAPDQKDVACSRLNLEKASCASRSATTGPLVSRDAVLRPRVESPHPARGFYTRKC